MFIKDFPKQEISTKFQHILDCVACPLHCHKWKFVGAMSAKISSNISPLSPANSMLRRSLVVTVRRSKLHVIWKVYLGL